MSESIHADYLVIGGGASAMAFVDTLLTEQPDSTVVIVDRHHRPGGHWNDAYPFVRLHQPSQFYGVASSELGDDHKDPSGLNAGLYGLASGAKVLAYLDQVMQQRFLPSGRVRWLPMSDYVLGANGEHLVKSLTSPATRQIVVRRKLVDATLACTAVPSTHPPKYSVAESVACVPLNDLPKIKRPYAAYTVVGSGKTGMDACLWLLENDVPPSAIRWVMPRDAWLYDRGNMQPGIENFERSMGHTAAQMDAVVAATSLCHLFEILEERGLLLRIDPTVEPTTFRCGTVSTAELAQLRRIEDVIRLGHVRSIHPTSIVLDQGTVTADPDTLYVDCSAGAIVIPPEVPIFERDRINLLMVRTCQPAFSCAVIAYVESHVADHAEQNALCAVVPSPELPVDWLRMWKVNIENTIRWRQHPGLSGWLQKCRLNAIAVYMRGVTTSDTARMALAQGVGPKMLAGAARLPALIAEVAG